MIQAAASAPTLQANKGEGLMQATIPKPAIPFSPSDSVPNGKILDNHGDTVAPAKPTTLMGRIDKAASEQVTLSRGTIWLIATALVLLGVAFSYGSSLVGWVRADEGIRVNQGAMQKDIDEMRQDVKEMRDEFKSLKDDLQKQAIKDAEQKGKALGYDVGRTDKQAGH